MAQLSDLIGKTLTRVENNNNTQILFEGEEGRWQLWHNQDCCESVTVEDVIGDLQDLVGAPILMAEKATNHENPKDDYEDSFTWTFYKFATIKGYVTIRWYGSSNGYYSESVDFDEC